jgi:hypothetical protein
MKDADTAWNDKRIKLPYPAFSVYPDDKEIYDRIAMLNKKENESQEPLPQEEGIKTPVEEVKEIAETKLPILLKKRKDIL